MYPYDDDYDRNRTPANWDSNSGTYHYSYTRPAPADPEPEPPRKKGSGVAKVIALVLCCALVGGGAGVGGAALYSHLTADRSATAGDGEGGSGTTIYQNDTRPTPVTVQQPAGLKAMTLAEINAAYADACVCVNTQKIVRQGYYQYQASGAGSGFIISEDGYIVTNYHVIEGASAVKVTLYNGESYDAKIAGGEELNDVAVLKVDGLSGLKTVMLGNSDDLVVGEQVCTIGNALGTLSFSLTAGAVSATGRSVTMSDGTVINMIQTDCTINSGNSGGPLFDSYGRVAGITSAKYSNNGQSSEASIEGIGFAIPINDVLNIVTDFMEHGYVTGRPYMGILNPMDIDDQAQSFGWPDGVYVKGVDENSCARKAGIKQGDIITKINDTEITGVSQLVSVKNSYRAGDTVKVTVFRSGEYLELELTFDEQTTESQPTQEDQQGGSGNYGGGYGNGGYGNGGYGYGYGDNGSSSFDPWQYFFGN